MLHHCVKLRLTLRRRQWWVGAAAAPTRGHWGEGRKEGAAPRRAGPGRRSDPVLFHALKQVFLFFFPPIDLTGKIDRGCFSCQRHALPKSRFPARSQSMAFTMSCTPVTG